MKPHGHYCKVCGACKANEKFSGKGHAVHICKDCAKLSPEQQAEQIALTRITHLTNYLSKAEVTWLKNRMKGRRPAVKLAATEEYEARFLSKI